MINKLNWHNSKIYDPATISARMKFVEKHMNGLLPLYGKEKEILIDYAKTHNLPVYEMICLRNTIKIQKEIDASRFFKMNMDKIKQKFVNEVNNIIGNNSKLKSFLKSVRMPLSHIFKILESSPEFKKLSRDNLDFLNKIKKMIVLNEQEIRQRSIQFEHSLEEYLEKQNLKFRTEEDIRNDKDYTLTPDILFDEPIILVVDNKEYPIRWMDAKNYMLVNVSFIMKSLHKQANKYNNVFGPGAFVFHYGIDSSIAIPNAVILDGSFLEPI